MSQLKIVATIILKEEYQHELNAVLHSLVDDTRAEVGCIAYDLHEDAKNPLKIVLIEVWHSQVAIDEHNKSSHFKAFVKAIAGKIVSLEIDIIKQVY